MASVLGFYPILGGKPAMRLTRFRVLSTVTAGSLALAVVASTVGSGGSPAPRHAALAAQTKTSQTVSLDSCPVLSTGSQPGACVAQLQSDLDSATGSNLTVDGAFGAQTHDAVIAFQQAHGLPQDGVVGPATKQALDTALSVPAPTAAPPSAPASGTSTASPAPADPATSGSSDAGKYTRTSHSFYGDRACIDGYCAPVAQSWLWYDSTDPSGDNLRRIQLNWADPEYSCSTWIDFDAWNTSGSVHYWHIQGATHTGCRFRDGLYALNDGTDNIPSGATATVCGTLFAAGNPQPKLLTRTCVNVP